MSRLVHPNNGHNGHNGNNGHNGHDGHNGLKNRADRHDGQKLWKIGQMDRIIMRLLKCNSICTIQRKICFV